MRQKSELKYKEYWLIHNPYDNTSLKECSNCHAILMRTMFNIRRGHRDGLNYLCRTCECTRDTNKRHKNVIQVMIKRIRQRAKENAIEFTITEKDIVVPEFCPILNLRLEMGYRVTMPHSPSLDRIDPSMGYIPGNIRVISHRANMLRNNSTLEELKLLLIDAEKLGKHKSNSY